MANKYEDRFKEQKTYEGFESDAKAAGLYDTFDAKDLERAKTDANYGYDLLNYKKGWTEANRSGDKEGEEFYEGMGQALRDSHDAKYTPKSSGSGTPTYSGALAAIKAYDDSLPGDKSSKYMTMIDSLFTQIAGDKFSYDAKSDPRYALAEEYAQRAMENQMAESALLSGGYGNSFAAASGQQVYTDYMNDAVNDMEDRAYSKWSAERDNKYNLLGIAQGLEERDYNRRYQAEQDAKADAETAKTEARNYVSDFIASTKSTEGLSPEMIATTGWDEAFINGLIAEAQSTESASAFEDALNKAETLAAYGNFDGYRALGYSEEEIASMENAYKSMTTPKTTTQAQPKTHEDEKNPFDYSEEYAIFDEKGFNSIEDAANYLVASGEYTKAKAEGIAASYFRELRSEVYSYIASYFPTLEAGDEKEVYQMFSDARSIVGDEGLLYIVDELEKNGIASPALRSLLQRNYVLPR